MLMAKLDDEPVIEPNAVEDIFADGILVPEVRGSYIRFKFTARREREGRLEREVIACVVATKEDAEQMLRVVNEVLGPLYGKKH